MVSHAPSKRLALAALLLGLALAPSARADEVRDAVTRVHARGEYDDRLRVGPGDGEPSVELGGGARGSRSASGQSTASSRSRSEVPSLGPGAGVLSYAILGLAAIAVLAMLGVLLARTRASLDLAPPRRPPEPIRAPIGGGRVALEDDPDLLASEGRFADAIAAALLRSFAALGWRPEGHAKSRTAREILASVPSSDGRRVTLADLVRLEERVAFGGDDATEARWTEARALWIATSSAEAPA